MKATPKAAAILEGARERPPTQPSDLELMLYADGELDGERLAEVEAWLAGDRDGRDKVAALHLVSSVVREQALGATNGGADLTEAIMGRVDREVAPEPPAREAPRPQPRPIANDNGRVFFAVAAGLVAAAAAALFWLRPAPAPDTGQAGGRPGAPSDTMAARSAPQAAVAAPHAQAHDAGHPGAAPSAPEAEIEHGVEVAAVDFGSSTGAVLYVPNGTSPSDTTTVVWLADDGDGEDE